MTPETRTTLRAAVERALSLPDLAPAERVDLIVAAVERLAPTPSDAPREPEQIVGVEYLAERLGVRPSRAYDVARNLPGRLDLGDRRLRFNKRALDEALASGGKLVKRGGRSR